MLAVASFNNCRNFSGEKQSTVVSIMDFFKVTGLFPLGVPSVSGGLSPSKLGTFLAHLPPTSYYQLEHLLGSNNTFQQFSY